MCHTSHAAASCVPNTYKGAPNSTVLIAEACRALCTASYCTVVCMSEAAVHQSSDAATAAVTNAGAAAVIRQ